MNQECKTELKPCEVVIRFKIPKDKMGNMYKIITDLNELGVHFDTGGDFDDENVFYNWELDWSLKGAKVYFKGFHQEEVPIEEQDKNKPPLEVKVE